MANKRYLNVDLIAFLEEKMKTNTKHYQQDFEIDKEFIRKAAISTHKEDKTLLWLSRPNGTLCVKEHDTFVKDTGAHQSWRFYAEQTADPIIAFAVELTGEKNKAIYGNAYELDYRAHVAKVASHSVNLQAFEKTFEDGYILQVPPDRSSSGFYAPLVEEHGPVIDSLAIPLDKEELNLVLASQKRNRDALGTAEYLPDSKDPRTDALDNTWITVYKDTLGIEDDLDNLTEICVPTEWLKKELEAEGETDLDAWLNEYTADNTEFIARDALTMGTILACDDLNIFLPGEEKELNTQIEYLYRDADNYKVWNNCIIKGTLSEEQKQLILDCRDEGEYFIPHLVGLPEKQFDTWDDQSDHVWFELWDQAFSETTDPPTVGITADELVNAFLACKEDWSHKPALDDLISAAKTRIKTTTQPPEPQPER